MPSVIRILDDVTINKIAAGEVIEGPGSSVKELIENAIDAKASFIRIEIQAGGRKKIEVFDNGIGMGEDDALLCFERHATSKVKSIEDLSALYTMGFRGEALASISAISKVRLLTRPRHVNSGTLVEVHGGKMIKQSSVACEVGTSFLIEDLFYNVPARKKFLKSFANDAHVVQKVVTESAFGHPEIHFQLISDGIKLLDIPVDSDYKARAERLLHPEVQEQCIPIEVSEGEFSLTGVIVRPSVNRPNRSGQTLFINSRPVVSYPIAESVLQGYSTSLPERRFPLFVLHLKIPNELLDVNVHPQKKEVRLAREHEVREFVKSAIAKTLSKKAGIEPVLVQEKDIQSPSYFQFQPVSFKFDSPQKYHGGTNVEKSIQAEFFLHEEKRAPKAQSLLLKFVVTDNDFSSSFHQSSASVFLMDPKRAEERLLYESLTSKPDRDSQDLLLIPLPIDLSQNDHDTLMAILPALHSCGFSIRQTGKKHFFIDALPPFISESLALEIIRGCLDESQGKQIKDIEEDAWHAIAKKAVGKVRRWRGVQSLIEADLLIERLSKVKNPHHNHLGEKIFALIQAEELERYFK